MGSGRQKAQRVDLVTEVVGAMATREEVVDVVDHSLCNGASPSQCHTRITLDRRVHQQSMEQSPKADKNRKSVNVNDVVHGLRFTCKDILSNVVSSLGIRHIGMVSNQTVCRLPLAR